MRGFAGSARQDNARPDNEQMLPLHEIIIKKFPLLLASVKKLGVPVPSWSAADGAM